MLDRVDVAILDVPRVIGFIADQMLPEPPLPDAALATRLADFAPSLLLRQRFRKARLDKPPPSRKIRVARGQRPYRVKMIRQDNDGINIEGIFSPRRGNGRSQYLDVIDKQRLPSLQQIDSEEPASTGDECAAIIRHADRLDRRFAEMEWRITLR
jgi:hypothetical protein